jgi:CubicO group peptidase (beta-lactamase class C family)
LFLRPWTRRAGQHWALAGELASCDDARQSPPLAPNAVGLVGFTGTSAWIEPMTEAVYVLLTNRHHPLYRTESFHPFRRRFHRAARLLQAPSSPRKFLFN